MAEVEGPRVIDEVDPDNIPVRVVNSIAGGGYFGSLFDITLRTIRHRQDENGNDVVEWVVAARLRFDLEMARLLRDGLDRQIAALTPPEGKAN